MQLSPTDKVTLFICFFCSDDSDAYATEPSVAVRDLGVRSRVAFREEVCGLQGGGLWPSALPGCKHSALVSSQRGENSAARKDGGRGEN